MEDIERLQALMMSRENVREIIKNILSQNETTKLKNSITINAATSIRMSISSLYSSSEERDGFFLFPDEIDPYALTSYLTEKNDYNDDQENVLVYICYALKKQINRFYKDINNGVCTVGRSTVRNRIYLSIFMKGIEERQKENLKMIRI